MARIGPTDPRVGFIAGRNAAVNEARGLRPVQVENLGEFRKRLRNTDRLLLKGFQKARKEGAGVVAARASVLAPQGPSGALKRSVKPFARGNLTGVRSPLPYANVVHWGGSTGRGHRPGVPWSGATLVRPSLFMSRALEEKEREIAGLVADAVDDAARKAGWK